MTQSVAQDELRRHFNKALDLSSDAFALIRVDHTIARVNRAWLEMHGFERDEEADVVGKPIAMFHNDAQLEHELKPMLDRVAKAGAAQGLLNHVKSDGESFQTWTTFARVGEGSNNEGYVVMSRDLSAEPTAANALRRTGGFLHSIVENIPDMVFVKDAEHLRYVLVNRAGEEFLGSARDELLGKSDFDLFPQDEAEARTSRERAILAGSVMVETLEEEAHTRLRGARWVHTKKIPILDANGKPRYLLGVVEDITDRKAYSDAQEALRLAQAAVKVRDEFLSFASHELRTPISAALLQVESLLRQAQKEPASLSEKMLARMSTIHRVMRRMATQVNQLLDVSKIASGHLQLQRAELDLSALVREIGSGLTGELTRSPSTLTIHADAPVVGTWDAMRLEEVATNLITNAFKYGNGKPIDVTVTTTPDDQARLIVRDQGIGIPPEDQAHIFDRFERAPSARTYSGFGLGLWIVRQIVTAHGGTIRVESVPDRGSTFTIDLPRSPS